MFAFPTAAGKKDKTEKTQIYFRKMCLGVNYM